MKSEILSATDWAVLPQIAVLIFVTVFLVALYRVYRPSAKAHYKKLAHLAIEDDVVVKPSNELSPSTLQKGFAHGRS